MKTQLKIWMFNIIIGIAIWVMQMSPALADTIEIASGGSYNITQGVNVLDCITDEGRESTLWFVKKTSLGDEVTYEMKVEGNQPSHAGLENWGEASVVKNVGKADVNCID